MKGPLFLLLSAVLAAGCGGGGGDDDDEPGTSPAAAESATFRSEAIGFTFEYPRDFAARRRPRQQVLGQVSVAPGDGLNAIKIRRTSNRELRPDRYLAAFERDFAGDVESVETREDRIGDLEVGVLELADRLERGGEEIDVRSTSYFFAGGGRTWQMECVADEEHGELIEAACKTALESIEFKRAD